MFNGKHRTERVWEHVSDSKGRCTAKDECRNNDLKPVALRVKCTSCLKVQFEGEKKVLRESQDGWNPLEISVS